MAFSFTGFAYLLGFFAIGLLTYRFFQYWQQERTVISKLFFYSVGVFCLFIFIHASAGLFFADNTLILKGTVALSTFLQSIACAIFGYLIAYLKFPKVSPWFGFLIVFLLGLIATYLSIVVPYIPPSAPFLEPSGGINWGFQPLADILRYFIYSAICLPLGIIFFQQFRTSKDPSVRAKAIGLATLFVFGLVAGMFDLFLESFLKLGAISGDIVFGFLSIALFIFILFVQKSPSPEKEGSFTSKSEVQW